MGGIGRRRHGGRADGDPHYSDETDSAHSQKLVARRTTDGVAWSAARETVALPAFGERPGMAVVRRAPSGAFVMSYEICGSDGCAAHLRFSADGWDWGDPRDRGLRPASLDGKHFRHAPTLAASATPGANGRLFLVGQLAFDGAGAQSADSGTILLGNTEGGGGNWYELAAPVAVADAYDNFCPNYSSAILPLEHGQVALEIASRWDGNRCRPYYARGPLAGTRDATGLSDGAAYRMTAVISGLCADIELGSTAPGANLRQWACNDSDAQRFTVAFQPDGSAQLKNVASGLCLAAAGDATTPGTNVEQQPCTDATTWQLAAVGRGYYQVRRRGAPVCLDVAGGSAVMGANVQ